MSRLYGSASVQVHVALLACLMPCGGQTHLEASSRFLIEAFVPTWLDSTGPTGQFHVGRHAALAGLELEARWAGTVLNSRMRVSGTSPSITAAERDTDQHRAAAVARASTLRLITDRVHGHRTARSSASIAAAHSRSLGRKDFCSVVSDTLVA
jgi:hypothetical protein